MLARTLQYGVATGCTLGGACLAFPRSAASSRDASMRAYKLTPTCELRLEVGDLTQFPGDAIVNAANEQMLGGGGVDAAIHNAAGPLLKQACRRHKAVRSVRCPTGEARLTPGFDLPATYVIHTVGPVYSDSETSAPLLASAYRSSLEIANQNGIKMRDIAFPAISCGVYGYPLEEAAEVAFKTCKEHCGELESITFMLFNRATAAPFVECAEAMFRTPGEDAADAAPESGTAGG